MIGSGSDNYIAGKDILRMSFLSLSHRLPEYGRRSLVYLKRVLKGNPSVLLIQGMDSEEYTIPTFLDGLGGTLIIGEYVRTSTERHGEKSPINAIWVRKGITVSDSRSIRISMTADGSEIVLAPDAITVTVSRRGTVFDIYNMESIPGAFNEALRKQAACIVNADAYRKKTRTQHHFDSTMVLAGDLHATPDASSIRYLKGLDTIRKATPSEWRDVWEELNSLRDNDSGIMQRMDVMAKYDETLAYPQFRNPRRTMYVMVYDDAFGRRGTPVKIERNGTGSGLADGTPLSASYGMDVDFYCPR